MIISEPPPPNGAAGIVSVTDSNTILVEVLRDTDEIDAIVIRLLDPDDNQIDNASITLPNEDLTVSYIFYCCMNLV